MVLFLDDTIRFIDTACADRWNAPHAQSSRLDPFQIPRAAPKSRIPHTNRCISPTNPVLGGENTFVEAVLVIRMLVWWF